MSIAAGTRFDRYEIRSLLGAGGMGEVYLAFDSRLERPVALKLLPPHLAADAARMRRFVREAKAASALNHSNILVVHEIVDDGPRPFIVAEFVDGITLRQRLREGPLPVAEAMAIAVQVAGALSAAHAAGVVHRDIKPENIMIRPDGVVKVLDFGLARSVEPLGDPGTQVSGAPHTPGASTVVDEMTGPGVVLGTVAYMSPEQARGQPVDHRTDIFACGVVLYEMLAGCAPFRRETPSDTIAALLTVEPTSLEAHRPETPAALARIVATALAKRREDRYQSAADLAGDLVAVQRGLEREQPRPRRFVTRSRRLVLAMIAAALLLAIAGIAWLWHTNRATVLTDKDAILIADFTNSTGDPVFDHTLKQGLTVQLSQSPFLDIFPDARVGQTLRLMGRAIDEPVAGEIAREICQRRGLKALVTGTIARLDRTYAIVLQAIAAESGESLAMAQAQAAGKDEVLRALSRAAADLRAQLGESLASIARFAAPLEVTTTSLDALKAFSLGNQHMTRGEYRAAMPYFQRAVELDATFAHAWMSRAIAHFNIGERATAQAHAAKAFALKDRLTELEKLRVTVAYHGLATGDVRETIAASEIYKRTYPRDYRPATNLAAAHTLLGQFERAVGEGYDAIRLNGDISAPHVNLAQALLALGRIADAKAVAEQAMARSLASPELPWLRYAIAFIEHDAAAMQRQLDWARERLDEHTPLDWEARAAAAAGQWQRARTLSRRATDVAVQGRARELAARYAANAALRDAAYGGCEPARALAAEALAIDRGFEPLARSTLALALCGDADRAQPLIAELEHGFPHDTLATLVWLPTIRAAHVLQTGNASRAASELAAVRFERAGELWPQYVRGHVLLRQQAWPGASAEFKKLIDWVGQDPLSPLHHLAHVGLAAAASGAGDTAAARRAYDDFFNVWKDADPNVPALVRARTVYARLVE